MALRSSPIAVSQQVSTVTATGVASTFTLPVSDFNALVLDLVVTAASGTTPTLDLYVQTLGPDGNWYDMVHFAQQTTTTTAGTGTFAIVSDQDSRYIGPVGNKTIGAGTTGTAILSNNFRVNNTVTGTTPSFTYALNVWAANTDKGGI